jgi:hypothetical protein
MVYRQSTGPIPFTSMICNTRFLFWKQIGLMSFFEAVFAKADQYAELYALFCNDRTRFEDALTFYFPAISASAIFIGWGNREVFRKKSELHPRRPGWDPGHTMHLLLM